MTINDVETNGVFEVKNIDTDDNDLKKRLIKMGMMEGSQIKIINIGEKHKIIKTNDKNSIIMGKNIYEKVEVELVEEKDIIMF